MTWKNDLLRLWFYNKYAFSLSVWMDFFVSTSTLRHYILFVVTFSNFRRLREVWYSLRDPKEEHISKFWVGEGLHQKVQSTDLEMRRLRLHSQVCQQLFLRLNKLVNFLSSCLLNPQMDLAILDPLIVRIISTVLKVVLSKLMPLTNVN